MFERAKVGLIQSCAITKPHVPHRGTPSAPYQHVAVVVGSAQIESQDQVTAAYGRRQATAALLGWPAAMQLPAPTDPGGTGPPAQTNAKSRAIAVKMVALLSALASMRKDSS